MITKDNFKKVLERLGFSETKNIFTKKFEEFECELKADFQNEQLIYPEQKGLKVNSREICGFSKPEYFVQFECVYKLLSQGYNPAHIELEPRWQVGHGASGGEADILVKDNDGKSLLIIECKTAGSEFTKAWNTTQTKPTQLFSYVQQTRTTKFISLYASDFVDNKIVSNYYLINVSDNDELLKNNPTLQSYKDASTVEEIYKVWSETYEKDFATLGLFEDNKAYDIGKTKFTSKDLKNINSKDIQGKYHEFATILRQHNVSGRENAFDKLVNLFLCKVTDEKRNQDELKFYWKGKAYDDPFDFQDRLQKLYQEGMEEFLEDEITYIDNSLIDEAFEVFKNKPNATKDKIKNYFRKLKFFTNNDFAFIDVHNKPLFEKNFEVLLKIARMIQDISLTGSDENQFLGDMFEGFLDQGVKQSEGQFFTPMPIVKFIINSLPTKENPKVIDYACGAGHFLNEYATTCKKSQIVGIEKEYRLSKVAKVSSFMYGSDIKIIYSDALSKSEKVKENSFDVLIANPPYSVKGFLETLSEDDRKLYELLETVDEKSYSANNAIECFFIERAKHLLCKDAVAGIVVPSSILNKGSQSIGSNKGNVYVGTREIILKYFDIVAIAEFGSGTFGKTGTNTVTLFLKRRGENPDLAEHLKNMVDSWFECDFETNKAFDDDGLLLKYCSHIEVDFEIYKTLLCQNLDEKIFEKDTFKEYRNTLKGKLKTQIEKKKKKEIENIVEKRKLSKDDHKKEVNKMLQDKENEINNEVEETSQKEDQIRKLLKYIHASEKEKLYYFMLASHQSNDVLIVKSPSDGKENKKFLGYEWSRAKGKEGIQYIGQTIYKSDDDSEFDKDDARILNNIANLNNIVTPLYNPQNSDDSTKINKIIKDNFEGLKTTIPKELESFVSRARLIDMLDFSRVDFNKALSLTPSKKVEIESKWELINLGENCEVITKGTTPTSIGFNFVESGINFIKIESINHNGEFDKLKFAYISKECNEKMNRSTLKENDILFSIAGALGRTAVVKNDILPANTNQALAIIRLKENIKFTINYLYLILQDNIIQDQIESLKVGVAQPNLSLTQIGNFKIPLPPLEIQEQIVKEIEDIDKNGIVFPISDIKKYQEEIKKCKSDILKKYLKSPPTP